MIHLSLLVKCFAYERVFERRTSHYQSVSIDHVWLSEYEDCFKVGTVLLSEDEDSLMMMTQVIQWQCGTVQTANPCLVERHYGTGYLMTERHSNACSPEIDRFTFHP